MALDNMDNERVDIKYLFYFFKSRGFNDVISGSAQPQITGQGLTKVKVPLPPLDEQKRIAAILDKADAIRRKRQQAIQLADDFLRSVFLDMFGDPLTNPKRWRSQRLGDMIIKGPTNGLYKPSRDYGKGSWILRIDGFYDGELEEQSRFKRVNVTKPEVEKFSLSERSIVINKVNSKEYLGKCAFVQNLEEPTLFESNMMNFKVDESKLNPRFLNQQLQMPNIKKQIATCSKDAVNQSSINQNDVKSFLVLVPDIELQIKFENIVKSTRSKLVSFVQSQGLIIEGVNSLSQKAFARNLS